MGEDFLHKREVEILASHAGLVFFMLLLNCCNVTSSTECLSNARHGDIVNSVGNEFSFRGEQRVYHIHVPKKYNPETPGSLVLFLHGNAGSATKAAKNSGFIEKSDAVGFVLVFPEGVQINEIPYIPGGPRSCSWNAGTCCSTAHKERVDDVAYIRAVLDDVQKRYCVSSENVFVAGYANGGMMAYRLVCELGERIKAVSIYAGALLHRDTRQCITECRGHPSTQGKCFNAEKCTRHVVENLPEVFSCKTSKYPVSILHMHGLTDPKTPFLGGIGKKSFEGVNYLPVEMTLDIFAEKNGCSMKKKIIFRNQTRGRDEAQCLNYEECKSGRIVLCTLGYGGHGLPGKVPRYCAPGSPSRKNRLCQISKQEMGPSSHSLDFTHISWEFFRTVKTRSVTQRWTARENNGHTSKGSLIMVDALVLLTVAVFYTKPML